MLYSDEFVVRLQHPGSCTGIWVFVYLLDSYLVSSWLFCYLRWQECSGEEIPLRVVGLQRMTIGREMAHFYEEQGHIMLEESSTSKWMRSSKPVRQLLLMFLTELGCCIIKVDCYCTKWTKYWQSSWSQMSLLWPIFSHVRYLNSARIGRLRRCYIRRTS